MKQLLKETEKYLQKLGSRLQEAKSAAGRSEHDVDEAGNGSMFENNEITLENEDESDQAKACPSNTSLSQLYLTKHGIHLLQLVLFSALFGKQREVLYDGPQVLFTFLS